MTVHATAQSGFDADAARYARGRPDYPAEVSGWLTDTLDLEPGKTVIDLGAGTGKFTRPLLQTGARVIAVEPVAAMRAKLSADLPEVEVLDGSATSIPLPDEAVDAIVCAQAFHWFDLPRFRLATLWPLLLVAIGGLIVLRALGRR